MLRLPALLVGVTALAACASSPPATAPSPSTGGSGTPSRAWVAHYGGTGEGHDLGQSVRVGPDGATTFVTGSRGTLAYRTATGAQLWQAPSTAFVGSGGSTSPPTLAVSPDGTVVYVAGTAGSGGGRPSPGSAGGSERAMTTAYDARTGRQLWTASYAGPAGGSSGASAVVATAGAVLVHGTSAGTGTGTDLLTLAYDPRTGSQRWVARYDGPAHGDEVLFPAGPRSLAVSRDGRTAVVTGASPGTAGLDAVTLGYDTASGARRWVSRYRPAGGGDAATTAVALSGDAAYVAGTSSGKDNNADVVVLGYDLATGAQRWTRTYDGPSHHNDGAVAVAVDPGGTRLVVAGTSEGPTTPGTEDWVVLGLDAASGTQRWAQRYDGTRHGDDNAAALVLSPDGGTAYVTGWSSASESGTAWATGAWATADGARRWVQPWSSVANPAAQEQPRDVAVSPDGRTLVVTGDSAGYATVAYRL